MHKFDAACISKKWISIFFFIEKMIRNIEIRKHNLFYICTMFDTTIYIGKIAIHEPVGVFTDCIIMILCMFFYKNLSPINKVIQYWRLFFLFLGFSTIVGACSHAFFAIHQGWAYKSFWLPMQLINGIAVYFAQKATLISVLKNSKYYKFWKWFYILQFITYCILLFSIQKYLVTVIENLIGLVPIMIIHFEAKKKERYYTWIGFGISISFIAGVVHATKASLHAYFNYNDIAHIIIMISLSVIYLGLKRKVPTGL